MLDPKILVKSFFSSRNIKLLFLFGTIYLALSFGMSFLGFISPETPVALKEHISIHLFVELGGHFLFGAVAALPFLDLDLIFLTGIFAVAIDSDHILDALGFYVSGRPDHSLFYAALSGLVLYYASRRMKLGRDREIKFAFLGPVVVFSHIAFDIFASYTFFIGKGYYFPLLDPFNFSTIALTFNYWIPFEFSAALLAFFALYLSRRISKDSFGKDKRITPLSKVVEE